MTPFPFQLDGGRWLAGKRTALLADEMGLGKTLQAILAADAIGAKTITVICPAIARPTWKREFLRWQKIDRSVAVFESWLGPLHVGADVQIFGYEFVSRDLFERAKRKTDVLIVDECHYLTNWKSKRTLAIYGTHGVIHAADHVWLLSGTPMRGSPASLWPMLYSVAPETILNRNGTPYDYNAFVNRYCTGYRIPNTPYGRFTPTGGKNLEELSERLRPFYLRRLASAVLPELPPIFFSDFPLDTDAKALPGFIPNPADSDDRMLRKVEGIDGIAEWREELSRVKAAASALTIMQELQLGLYDKIVVYTYHREAHAMMLAALDDLGAVGISGDSTPFERELAVLMFQDDPKIRVIVCNIIAAGMTLTLTAAAQIFFVEMDRSAINNAQAAMRTRRIGQQRPTFVRCAMTADPMDQMVTAALRRQTQAIRGVFGDGVETQMMERAG